MVGPISKLLRKYQERRRFENDTRADVFQWIYQTNKWGGAESRSGKGSDLVQSQRLRDELPTMLRELEIESILDLPCGDLNWISALDLSNYQYLGADIVPEIVDLNRRTHPELRFEVLDVCEDPLPDADIMLSRDLMVHLCFADIRLAIENIRGSSIRYLGCTTFTDISENEDKLTGKHHRINMLIPPFSWGEPLVLLPDGERDKPTREGKSLGVWEVKHLPSTLQWATSKERLPPRPAGQRNETG